MPIFSLNKKVEKHYIPLTFKLDTNKQGKHLVRIFYGNYEKRKQIKNIRKIWNYGFSIVKDNNNKKIEYTISDKDYQTILALKSLNPEISDDGSLIFKIEPNILSYLRRKDNINESE